MRKSLVIALLGGALAAGCAVIGPDEVAKRDVEQELVGWLKTPLGAEPRDAVCPGGLPAEVGARLACFITTAEGVRKPVYLTVTRVRDDVVVYFNVEIPNPVAT